MQILEKENSRLELELKDVLKDLNWQKEKNDLMRDEVARLEMSLKSSKVLLLLSGELPVKFHVYIVSTHACCSY